MVPVLGYWNTRCYAQPIRFLLEYKGTNFNDVRYQVGPAPDYDKTCWFSVKYNLELDFPNLPYYIDEDVRITQTLAILRYLARKNDLCGKTEEERLQVDMLTQQAWDFGNAFINICYQNFDQKDEYMAKLPTSLRQFSNFLGDKHWFVGNSVTMPDFLMYEFLDHHLLLDSHCLRDFPNLEQFMQSFRDLPPIKQYMASSRFLAKPMFNVYYMFGGEK